MKKISYIISSCLCASLLIGCSSSFDYEEYESNLLSKGYEISSGTYGAYIKKEYPNGDLRIISYNIENKDELECIDSYLFSGIYFDLNSGNINSAPSFIENKDNVQIDEYKEYVVSDLANEDISLDDLSNYLNHITGMERDDLEPTSNDTITYRNKTYEEEYLENNYTIPSEFKSSIEYLEYTSENADDPWNIYLSDIRIQDNTYWFEYSVTMGEAKGCINYSVENGTFKGIIYESQNGTINTSTANDDYLLCLFIIQSLNQSLPFDKDNMAEMMTQIELSKTVGAGFYGNSTFALDGNLFTITLK